MNIDKHNRLHKTNVGAIASIVYLIAFIWIFIQCLGADAETLEAEVAQKINAEDTAQSQGNS